MKKMINLVLLTVVRKDDKHPQGSFKAVYYNETGVAKSKECSIQVHGVDIAYETVDLWAEDKAKEFNIPYEKKSKNELIKLMNSARGYKVRDNRESRPTDGITTGANRSLLANKKYFNAEVKRCFEHMGHAKLSEQLTHARKYLDGLERERNSNIKKLSTAKETIAQALFRTYVDTGLDTSNFCNDDEIIKRFNELKDKKGDLL